MWPLACYHIAMSFIWGKFLFLLVCDMLTACLVLVWCTYSQHSNGATNTFRNLLRSCHKDARCWVETVVLRCNPIVIHVINKINGTNIAITSVELAFWHFDDLKHICTSHKFPTSTLLHYYLSCSGHLSFQSCKTRCLKIHFKIFGLNCINILKNP